MKQGIEGKCVACGNFNKAERDPIIGGLTEQVNDNETYDN
jgi:hypothetical protein